MRWPAMLGSSNINSIGRRGHGPWRKSANATQPTRQALIEFARARVGYKAPEEIVFLREMPLDTVGKVDRAALKRIAAPDRPRN